MLLPAVRSSQSVYMPHSTLVGVRVCSVVPRFGSVFVHVSTAPSSTVVVIET